MEINNDYLDTLEKSFEQQKEQAISTFNQCVGGLKTVNLLRAKLAGEAEKEVDVKDEIAKAE